MATGGGSDLPALPDLQGPLPITRPRDLTERLATKIPETVLLLTRVNRFFHVLVGVCPHVLSSLYASGETICSNGVEDVRFSPNYLHAHYTSLSLCRQLNPTLQMPIPTGCAAPAESVTRCLELTFF
ncbi:unnamed protein product [Protopolystoma xenopodis]|uniref:Uncharacterized protein n=1 Tax=Protopolystoma xenopodis TaxID=117903 RepID=A0A448WMM5_9PLAT|nr:unnamed protein product [Protopolystoma xenopodis]